MALLHRLLHNHRLGLLSTSLSLHLRRLLALNRLLLLKLAYLWKLLFLLHHRLGMLPLHLTLHLCLLLLNIRVWSRYSRSRNPPHSGNRTLSNGNRTRDLLHHHLGMLPLHLTLHLCLLLLNIRVWSRHSRSRNPPHSRNRTLSNGCRARNRTDVGGRLVYHRCGCLCRCRYWSHRVALSHGYGWNGARRRDSLRSRSKGWISGQKGFNLLQLRFREREQLRLDLFKGWLQWF